MRNLYFSDGVRSEQNLYENIVIEALKMYGQDLYYLPRDIVGEDKIFGDDVPSRFNSAYKLEMYIENIEGFDGEGDLFTRFGVEIRDEATFVVARQRWNDTVRRHDNEITGNRPREGDLLYFPLTNKIFEIMHVEHEQPFYQLANLPVFKLRANLFEYSSEDLDTNIEAIDRIQSNYDYAYLLELDSAPTVDILPGNTITQVLSSGVNMVGEVSRWTESDNTVYVVGSGATDGLYHSFITTSKITVSGFNRADSDFTILSVNEENQLSSNEQNDIFTSETADFLDFTENNPFGDPENN